jgi:phage-Barnase-EndoU-ColicinE5/D-RelE like nuclease3
MPFLDLDAFAVRSLAATNVQEKLTLGLVVNHEAIALATGWDVSGFSHVIENFGLKHGFKHHGNPSVETPRGQRAVTVDDVMRIPETISKPNKITFDGLSKHSKQPVIGFEREFGAETLVYKAEIRKGRKELATQTFYVRVRQ